MCSPGEVVRIICHFSEMLNRLIVTLDPSNSLLGSVGGQPLFFFSFFFCLPSLWLPADPLISPSPLLLSLAASLLLLLFICWCSVRDSFFFVFLFYFKLKAKFSSDSGPRDQIPVSSRAHYAFIPQSCSEMWWCGVYHTSTQQRPRGRFSLWGSGHASTVQFMQYILQIPFNTAKYPFSVPHSTLELHSARPMRSWRGSCCSLCMHSGFSSAGNFLWCHYKHIRHSHTLFGAPFPSPSVFSLELQIWPVKLSPTFVHHQS